MPSRCCLTRWTEITKISVGAFRRFFLWLFLRFVLRFSQFFKFLRHGGIVPGQALDGQVLRLAVGQAQVVFGGQQGVLGFLQMIDGFVDLLDGFLEFLAGQTVIAGEFLLKIVHIRFKMGDIDILATFTAYNNNNVAYTAFFMNDGNGHFTKQNEQNYGTNNELWFSECQDVDGDGYYDLLAFKGEILNVSYSIPFVL